MHSDRLLLLAIHLLRCYTLHAPWGRGRWLLASLIRACARKLVAQHDILIRARDGRRFRIDPRERQYQMGLLDLGVFEAAETAALAHCVEAGDVVVDAGANYGWYTTYLSRLVGNRGHVHAFEPMPQTADTLEDTCRLNDCRNVTVNRCALGERMEQCILYHQPGQPSGDATLFPARDADLTSYPCPVITLDYYFATRRLSRCDLIKCDIEGAELSFLRGATRVLNEHRPIVLIELNPAALNRAGSTARDIVDKLRQHADYVFVRVDAPEDRLVILKPSDCDGLQDYANVLCIPNGSRALDRLGVPVT